MFRCRIFSGWLLFGKGFYSALQRLLKKGIDRILNREKPENTPPIEGLEASKTHPWRLCPIGEHWVVGHDLSVPPSARRPGYVTLRDGHCRKNSGLKQVYKAQEFREIAHRYFESVRKDPDAMPIPDDLGYPNGNEYDLSIAGWTKFWNETLKPERPVTPDFIKVLISTESDFIVPKEDTFSKIGPARGLIQITEQIRKILQDPNGELRDHLIELTVEESREIEPNIAAGIRWLYHKRNLLEGRIKRIASWEEVAAEYKGIFRDIGKDETTNKIMEKMRVRHTRLKERRKGK